MSEFRIPALRFEIRKETAAGRRLRLIACFKDSSGADLEKLSASHGLRQQLAAHEELGAWKAAAGQSLLLADRNVMLLGLGEAAAFHPETWCSAFRAAGEKLGRFKDYALEVVISDEVRDAVARYSGAESDFRKRLSLSFSGARRRRKGAGNARNKSGESEDLPDYVGPYSLEELIAQSVASLNTGAEPMETLKSSTDRGAKSRSPRKDLRGDSIALHFSGKSPAAQKLRAAGERGLQLARALHGARYVASLPGNHFHPEHYERYARQIAHEAGLKLRVFGRPELEKLGAGGILAVGRGSAISPRMIVLEYTPPRSRIQQPVVLVGKGVTFDTGGISLKPPAEMHEMKYDMCGSALALHTIALASRRKLPTPLVAILGIVENMPDGAAIKPGDVYTALNGLTVEVQNTDAEGRLVLADALSYACKHYDSLCLLDFATLTGACVIALGHEAAGLMTASEDLAQRLDLASRKSLDRLWRLPHWAAYGGGLKSDTADLRNIAGRPAGTVTAMRFLSRFVSDETPWAHIDIAGVAWRGKGAGSQPRGATGWGLRLMNQFLEDLIQDAD
ncbi:MAG: leucyl aminopeptidase [Leptospirales bacterium]|nr:leucyl aminopeptidase [Leptospirales bacterium]